MGECREREMLKAIRFFFKTQLSAIFTWVHRKRKVAYSLGQIGCVVLPYAWLTRASVNPRVLAHPLDPLVKLIYSDVRRSAELHSVMRLMNTLICVHSHLSAFALIIRCAFALIISRGSSPVLMNIQYAWGPSKSNYTSLLTQPSSLISWLHYVTRARVTLISFSYS